MLFNHLRTALRNCWKQRSTNAINVTGLSVGMTAAILIFLWVGNELTYDDYHPDAGRIFRITSHIASANWTWESSPLQLARAIRVQLPEIQSVTSFTPGYNTTFRLGNEFVQEKQSAYVDSSWFNIFHYDFLEGNAATFLSNRYSVALTRSKAKKYFGNADPMGRTLRIDTIDYRVAAVLKDLPANSSFQFDFLMPLDAYLSNPAQLKNDLGWGNYNYQNYLKLRPGADPKKVATAITAILLKNTDPERGKSNFESLIPLKDIHFETDLSSNSGQIIHTSRSNPIIFSVLGIFLLVIACINYVNLTTARASLRAKEVGIRKIIGAGKKSLFLQFITESLVISTLSLLITLALVWLALPLFRQLTDKQFTAPFANPQIWKIIGITLLTATALNGVYPALLLSSFRPLNVLKGATILKFKDVYLRKSLVVLQFTFSIILIIGTLIIRRQLDYIQNTSPGYNRSQVFALTMPWKLFHGKTDEEAHALRNTIKHQLLEQTGIKSVSSASQSIVHLGSSNSGSADWDGHDTSFRPTVFQLSADEDYDKVLGLQMQQGRWFDPTNTTDRHNFILNETAANTFNIHQPILGQRFSFQGDTGKIIGVVKDFHIASLHEKIKPTVIFNRESWRSTFFIRTDPGQSAKAIAAARAVSTRYGPARPFTYSFLDEEFDNLYKTDKKVSTLILVFSVIAILISCLGLFALAAFTAQQRIKEIGIRKVLGATVPNIVGLLSRDFVRLVLLSVLIATPIAAWAMYKWLEDFAYHIPLSAGFFIAAGLLALLVAVLTISTQSVRAATTNPAKSLRSE